MIINWKQFCIKQMYITEPTTCYIFRQKWDEILHELATLSYIPGYTWVPCPPWLGVSWWNCLSRIHYSLFRNLCSLKCQFPYNFWKWFFFFFLMILIVFKRFLLQAPFLGYLSWAPLSPEFPQYCLITPTHSMTLPYISDAHRIFSTRQWTL